MTLFEYLAIAYSLVFSLAALRLVAGLPHALDASRRYWVHVVYVFLGLFSAVATFWAQWAVRKVEWTFPLFLMQLAGPAMLYYLACTVMPDNPSSVASWYDYFYWVRRRLFGGICIWAGILATNATLLAKVPLFHPYRFVELGVLSVGVTGFISDRPSVHRAILIWSAVLVVASLLVLLRPFAA